MKYKLVKLTRFSGEKASIYSIYLTDECKTLFDIFIEENINSFLSEIKDIFSRLRVIGNKTGARVHFFKEYEGKPGDGICALYDTPENRLRLYCIRYGTTIVILGGGGYKPKSARAFQEIEKLEEENYFLREIAEMINNRIKNHDIVFTEDYMDFEGNMEFYENEE